MAYKRKFKLKPGENKVAIFPDDDEVLAQLKEARRNAMCVSMIIERNELMARIQKIDARLRGLGYPIPAMTKVIRQKDAGRLS